LRESGERWISMSKKHPENIDKNIQEVRRIEERNSEPPENRDTIHRFLREKSLDRVWKERKILKRK
jgi:hypothetical protein